LRWVAAVDPSYPLVTVQVVPATVPTRNASVSMLQMNGVAGNPVEDVTVTLVPDVSVIALANVVCAKLA
jgi:hypothetical protein